MAATVVRDGDRSGTGERRSLRLWLELMKASKAIEAGVGSHLRQEHGQSLARFDVLSQLYRIEGDWAAVGEIAAMVMASSGNITALLDRMAADGLIERRASLLDRRSHQIRVTAAGSVLFAEMTRDHARWIDAALDGIGADEKDQLIRLLVRLRRTFDANTAPAN